MDQFIEFLKHWLPTMQIVTVIVGTLAAFKQRNRLLNLFVLFLWYAILNEFFADYYGTEIQPGNNSIVYNVFYPVFFGVLFYLLHQSRKSRRFKQLIVFMYGSYFISMFIELFVLGVDYTLQRQSLPYIIAGTSLLVCFLYFFVELLREELVMHVERNMVFWIATAYFFYLLAYVPLKVEQNYYANSVRMASLFDVYFIMTLIMNLFLIIGFVWSSLWEEK